MKRLTGLLLFIIFFSIFFSCKKEESILEGETPPRYFYIVTSDQPNSVKLFEFPSKNIIDEDVYFSRNGSKLDDISQIIEYRGYVYLLQKKSFKISIVTADSFKLVAELDWKTHQLEPSSISFVNATTAFISFQDTALVSVLDLTNFKLAKNINVASPIYYLDNASFYVLGLSLQSGDLIVIDSRTYTISNTINAGDRPLALAFNQERSEIFVLCVGKGKIDTSNYKTNAKLIAYKFPDFSKFLETDIIVGSINAQTIIPTGIVVPGRYYGIITTLSGFLRFSLTNPKLIQRYIVGEFFNLLYDYKRDQIIAISKSGNISTIYLINPTNTYVISKIIFNKDISLIFPK